MEAATVMRNVWRTLSLVLVAGFVLRAAQIYFDGKVTPLITWVGVTSLVLPQALVEIEALAAARN